MLDYEKKATNHFLSIINLRGNKHWWKHVINIPRQKLVTLTNNFKNSCLETDKLISCLLVHTTQYAEDS